MPLVLSRSVAGSRLCDGAITFGYMVEAAAPAAARTAETSYGKVSVSGAYAAGVDTVAELLPFMHRKQWKVISGTGGGYYYCRSRKTVII